MLLGELSENGLGFLPMSVAGDPEGGGAALRSEEALKYTQTVPGMKVPGEFIKRSSDVIAAGELRLRNRRSRRTARVS